LSYIDHSRRKGYGLSDVIRLGKQQRTRQLATM